MATKVTAGALATTVPYTMNARRTDSFSWRDWTLNAVVGGFGGFMVGKGGLALMGVKGKIATRAGKGIATSGGLYSVGNLLSEETFDRKDFLIESGFGGLTPSVQEKLGAAGLGAAVISALSSGSESVVKDIVHGQSIDWIQALEEGFTGGVFSWGGDVLKEFLTPESMERFGEWVATHRGDAS